MNNLISSRFALIFVAAVAASTCAIAQNTPQATAPVATEGQRQLASKLVDLQRGPDMERMVFQLTAEAVQPLISKWGPKLETMPKAKQEKAREQLNAELKTLGDNTRKLIEAQMNKSADSALLPAYIERFSESEMKELLAAFESPAFKKYQKLTAELGDIWVKSVVQNTMSTVKENGKAFDTAAEKIIDDKPVGEKPVVEKSSNDKKKK